MGGEAIQTNELYRYGYFEVRMRVPRDPGIITAVFTYSGYDPKRSANEIDIEHFSAGIRARSNLPSTKTAGRRIPR